MGDKVGPSLVIGAIFGVMITLFLIISADGTYKAARDEWKTCGQNRPAFVSDSAFYARMPQCHRWSDSARKEISR